MLNVEKAINDLVEKGWFHQNDFISRNEVLDLANVCRSRTLVKASIGKGGNKTINEGIRSDNISWLSDKEEDSHVKKYQKISKNNK